jgi:di/tricarboxylate transporter
MLAWVEGDGSFGLSDLFGEPFVDLMGWQNPETLMSASYYLSMILTQPMSNQAAAVVVIPIAIQTATTVVEPA